MTGALVVPRPVGALAATPPATTKAAGGPVVLDGMDPFCHSGGRATGTGAYIDAVLTSLHAQAANDNDGSIAVVGSASTSTATSR